MARRTIAHPLSALVQGESLVHQPGHTCQPGRQVTRQGIVAQVQGGEGGEGDQVKGQRALQPHVPQRQRHHRAAARRRVERARHTRPRRGVARFQAWVPMGVPPIHLPSPPRAMGAHIQRHKAMALPAGQRCVLAHHRPRAAVGALTARGAGRGTTCHGGEGPCRTGSTSRAGRSLPAAAARGRGTHATARPRLRRPSRAGAVAARGTPQTRSQATGAVPAPWAHLHIG